MFVQLKTGHNTDQGPCWISRVMFSKSWQTAYFHGLELRRQQGVQGNFVDVANGDEWWISGPKRNLTDSRYSSQQPMSAMMHAKATRLSSTASHFPAESMDSTFRISRRCRYRRAVGLPGVRTDRHNLVMPGRRASCPALP